MYIKEASDSVRGHGGFLGKKRAERSILLERKGRR